MQLVSYLYLSRAGLGHLNLLLSVQIQNFRLHSVQADDKQAADQLVKDAQWHIDWYSNNKDFSSNFFGGEIERQKKIEWYKKVLERCEQIRDKVYKEYEN